MTNETLIGDSTEKRGLTRRQIATGAMWSVPVILLAASTPTAAAATSGSNPLDDAYILSDSGISRASGPARIRINPDGDGGKYFYFEVPVEGGGNAAAGQYGSGQLSFLVQWGLVANSAAFTLTEEDLHGWSRVGDLPASSTEGSITYTHAGRKNGSTNAVILPNLRMTPTSGTLGIYKFKTTISAANLTAEYVKNLNYPQPG
jgi:hypothetical protein